MAMRNDTLESDSDRLALVMVALVILVLLAYRMSMSPYRERTVPVRAVPVERVEPATIPEDSMSSTEH